MIVKALLSENNNFFCFHSLQGKSGALSETPIKEEGESSPESLTEQLKLQWITSVSHKKG